MHGICGITSCMCFVLRWFRLTLHCKGGACVVKIIGLTSIHIYTYIHLFKQTKAKVYVYIFLRRANTQQRLYVALIETLCRLRWYILIIYIYIYKYNLILSLTSDSPMCTKGLKYTDDEFVNDLQKKNIGGNLCKNEIINLNSTEKL